MWKVKLAMKNFLIASISFFALLWGGQRLLAQENINLVIRELVNDNYPELSFEITPNNDFGVPIDQLTADNFDISDDVGPLEITLDEQIDADEPIAIMLVLDASGSMQQSGRLAELKSQAVAFRDSLNSLDQMGVLFFNIAVEDNGDTSSEARVALFPSADPREFPPSLDGGGAVNFINQFAAGDELAGTPLYDAMFRSVQVLARDTQAERRAVVVITDGVDHAQGVVKNSEEAGLKGSIYADMEVVVTTAQQENIPIFTIGLSDETDSISDAIQEAISGVDAVELTKIARSTGGAESIDQSVMDLAPLLSIITNKLKTKYIVTTQALAEPDNEEHNLTIQVTSKLGTSTTQQAFRALYPLEPLIKLSFLNNEELEYEASRLAAGISGSIDLQPIILSRNDIAKVEYFVEDDRVHQAIAPPFNFKLDTSIYFNRIGILTDLKIVATDSSGAHIGELEQDMLILSCSLVCLAAENNFTTLDTNTFIAIWLSLAFLILLLIFFVVFSLVRSRRRRHRELVLEAQAAQAYTAYQYPMPVIPITDEQIDAGPLAVAPAPSQPTSMATNDTIIDSAFTPGGPVLDDNKFVESGSALPPLATEVLSRPPSRLAYLFNPTNGQQHQLNDVMVTIGRSPENRICMPDVAVSGKHAVIKVENDRYIIYGLGASNPIMINGNSIFNSHPLSNNDLITIGREDWVFKELDQ